MTEFTWTEMKAESHLQAERGMLKTQMRVRILIYLEQTKCI